VTAVVGGAAYGQGGGLHNEGTAVLTDSTVNNNTADVNSWVYAGIHVSAGGAGISNWGSLSLTHVAVTGNFVGGLWDPFPDPPQVPIGSVSGNAGGGGISSPVKS